MPPTISEENEESFNLKHISFSHYKLTIYDLEIKFKSSVRPYYCQMGVLDYHAIEPVVNQHPKENTIY